MKVRFVPPVLFVLCAACTGGPPPPTEASSGRVPTPLPVQAGPTASGPAPVYLDVVATTSASAQGSASSAGDDSTYLDGIELAAQAVNAAGGIRGRPLAVRLTDDEGDPNVATTAIDGVLDRKPLAVLYVGPGTALLPLRPRLAVDGTPVILLQGDLYTSRQLFWPVFQTTIPWEWQAHTIARYLVVDRKAKDIVFVGSGPEAPAAAAATGDALQYWGGHLGRSYLTPPVPGTKPPSKPASDADAAIVFGTAHDVRAEVGSLMAAPHPPRIGGGESLLVPVSGFDQPPPGTTACSTYTWAGWAQPIKRVGAFIGAFRSSFGRAPKGLEQEGYDAVRAVALGLQRDRLRGGPDLTAALEGIVFTNFSSFPVTFGPDDHVFPPRDEIGLFAVPGAAEKLDPWQVRGDGELWRPVMRTFTSDGTRDDILDQDRRVFFPFWRTNHPGPYYWQSRYGIVSRPKDRLH